MSSTLFFKKDGNASSLRTSTKTGKNKISFTNYIDGKGGGVTFKAGNMTTRLNKNGQCIGVGLTTGRKTTYFGKNGNVVTKLPSLE